jgi:hypothetical protein
LSECLEALSSEKRTLEECLSLYPEDAARLEPLLRTAALLAETCSVEPRPAFAARARERVLRMAEPSLREELAAEPRPSFVMAAAASVLVFLSVGGFAVTTSADTLPGDWRYPVKRTMEDIRFNLTFDEGGRRQLNIDLTQERLNEVQKLGEQGRRIGEGPLDDLASQTNSLVNAKLDVKDAEKVSALALQQQQVLQNVAPLVDPQASDELQEAKTASTKVYVMASSVVLAANGSETPLPTPVATGEAAAASTPTTPATEAAQPTQSAATVATPTPEPELPELTPIPGAVVVAPVKNENAAGVSWDLVVIGRLSLEVPSQSSGWSLLGLDVDPYGVASAPSLLRLANADVSTLIIVNPRNGDTYWDQNIDGVFQESVVRRSDGPILWQATEDELAAFSPANADVVFHLLNSIVVKPPLPTATPTPPPTVTPEPTTAVSNSAATAAPTPAS